MFANNRGSDSAHPRGLVMDDKVSDIVVDGVYCNDK